MKKEPQKDFEEKKLKKKNQQNDGKKFAENNKNVEKIKDLCF